MQKKANLDAKKTEIENLKNQKHTLESDFKFKLDSE